MASLSRILPSRKKITYAPFSKHRLMMTGPFHSGINLLGVGFFFFGSVVSKDKISLTKDERMNLLVKMGLRPLFVFFISLKQSVAIFV